MRFLHTKIHHHFYLFNNERLAQFAFSFAMYLQNGGLCEEKRRACKCVSIERGETCLPWGDIPPECERTRRICGGYSAIGLRCCGYKLRCCGYKLRCCGYKLRCRGYKWGRCGYKWGRCGYKWGRRGYKWGGVAVINGGDAVINGGRRGYKRERRADTGREPDHIAKGSKMVFTNPPRACPVGSRGALLARC